jgi:diphthamide biosynthesis enzyme Dph1/Dph2-like protein
MKLLFIEARKKIKLKQETEDKLAKLPAPICVYYTIQYKDYASQVKSFLESKGKKIKSFEQVLGCTRINSALANCPILYIGSGLFHLYNIAKQTKVPIYILDFGNLRKLDKGELEELENKKKAALSRFYSADSVGIIVSCKPGQEKLQEAIKLKSKIEKKGKKASIFISDNITESELENYGIDSWLNTACPGIALDSVKIVNSGDLNLT